MHWSGGHGQDTLPFMGLAKVGQKRRGLDQRVAKLWVEITNLRKEHDVECRVAVGRRLPWSSLSQACKMLVKDMSKWGSMVLSYLSAKLAILFSPCQRKSNKKLP